MEKRLISVVLVLLLLIIGILIVFGFYLGDNLFLNKKSSDEAFLNDFVVVNGQPVYYIDDPKYYEYYGGKYYPVDSVEIGRGKVQIVVEPKKDFSFARAVRNID